MTDTIEIAKWLVKRTSVHCFRECINCDFGKLKHAFFRNKEYGRNTSCTDYAKIVLKEHYREEKLKRILK